MHPLSQDNSVNQTPLYSPFNNDDQKLSINHKQRKSMRWNTPEDIKNITSYTINTPKSEVKENLSNLAYGKLMHQKTSKFGQPDEDDNCRDYESKLKVLNFTLKYRAKVKIQQHYTLWWVQRTSGWVRGSKDEQLYQELSEWSVSDISVQVKWEAKAIPVRITTFN